MPDRAREDEAQATTSRGEDGLAPAEVMERARPGDTVRFTMRGPPGAPFSDEELASTLDALEAQYPGVMFEVEPYGEPVSRAELVPGVGPS